MNDAQLFAVIVWSHVGSTHEDRYDVVEVVNRYEVEAVCTQKGKRHEVGDEVTFDVTEVDSHPQATVEDPEQNVVALEDVIGRAFADKEDELGVDALGVNYPTEAD